MLHIYIKWLFILETKKQNRKVNVVCVIVLYEYDCEAKKLTIIILHVCVYPIACMF